MDFNKLTRLFLPLVVNGVLEARRNSHDRLIEKLDELQFYTRDIVQNQNETNIELQILDEDLLCQLLAGEANKFFLASRLTHDRATQAQLNNASWQAVEHYYAAYYAAHYLIRLTGVSLTNLDAKATATISRSQLTGASQSNIPNGLYTLRYDKLAKTLQLKKKSKKGSGGSHQEAWQLWEELVKKLQSRTDSDLAEYISTSLDLTTHLSFLLGSTGKYNPPELRGEINYQFKGGSWIFEKNADSSIRRLQRAISETQSSYPVKAKSSEALIFSNKLIINLAKTIFIHTSEKFPRSTCRYLANKYKFYVS